MNDDKSPESFFYFAALNSEDRKRWAANILLENRVYFRKREQLNDPNELRPSIVFEGTDREIRKFVRNLILTRWPIRLSPADRLREESRLIYKYRNTPQWVEGMLHEILDRVGVFCLSEVATEPLLWAHYADGHRGIGIEFDPELGLFASAQQVIYSNDAPIINRLVDSSNVILEKSMLTKGVAWAYEREWRVIARWGDSARIAEYLSQHDVPATAQSFMRDQHGPGYYSFPIEAIRSLILGSRITTENEAWLRSILEHCPTAIPIRRARIAKDNVVTVE